MHPLLKKILDPPLCLSGEGSENGEKTTIGLISKKATLHVQHTFFVHFLAVVLHDYNVKLPETSWLHVLWRKCRTCSCSLFFHCRSFSPRWPLAFLIFSPPLQNFMLFLQQKMSSARESSAITIINGRSVIIGVFTFVRLNYAQENLE